MNGYEARTARLRQDFAALPADVKVRLAKKTSNLFRARTVAPRLNVDGFDRVLGVDPNGKTADVLGMTTYEHLVDATLPHGLMPLVVPQLKTITLGGAVAGLGIESSSFRNGMPHESVLEMEILTGDGRIVRARPDNEHANLFFGFPNSYGTLGYALRLTIELEPIKPFVQLRHIRFDDARALFEALPTQRADFIDGTVFSRNELYLTLGTFTDITARTSDYTGQDIYYQSIQRTREDALTTRAYLWRWDTDWFWCSRAFGVQNPRIRRFIPRRYLRSDVYWRLLAVDRRFQISRRLDRLRKRPEAEQVIQDVEIPAQNAAEFLEFFHNRIGITPIWLCPLRRRDPRATWTLYTLDPNTMYVNFGFWSSIPSKTGENRNRLIEQEVERVGGRKSLYSTSFYPEDEFRRIYNGADYDVLKKEYDPENRLPDLYHKAVREGRAP